MKLMDLKHRELPKSGPEFLISLFIWLFICQLLYLTYCRNSELQHLDTSEPDSKTLKGGNLFFFLMMKRVL